MRISDWSSDVCSSDLRLFAKRCNFLQGPCIQDLSATPVLASLPKLPGDSPSRPVFLARAISEFTYSRESACRVPALRRRFRSRRCRRSEEHTSELQSLMRISYAVFCLKKKKYQ